MTLKTQVARGLKWQAINIVGKQLLSLVVVTTLTRLLEPSAFGLIALVGVYLGFVTMFIDQGIAVALIQRQDLQPEHKDAAFWFNMACAVFLCLTTIAAANQVALIFKEPSLASLLRWGSLGLVIGAASEIHATLFTRAMDFRRPVIRGLIGNLVGGAVGVGMALGGCGVWSLVGQQLAGSAAGAIFLWTMSDYRPSLKFSLRHLRELFGFSLSSFATSLLWYFWTRIDQVVIGRFAGMPVLGLYSIAGKIPSMATTLTHQPLTTVSLPSMSRLQDDHATMRQAVRHGMELNAVISFPIFVGLALVAHELVPLLFGARWAGAAGLCALLSLDALILALQVFFYPVLLASGGIGKYVWLCVCQASGVLIASVVGIHFGVTFLVLGLIINSFLIAFAGLFFIYQRIRLSPAQYCRPCLFPAIASILMAAVVWGVAKLLPTDVSLILRLVVKVLAGAATYLGSVYLLAPSALKALQEMVGHAFQRPNAVVDVPAQSDPVR